MTRDDGWVDMQVDMKMILSNGTGTTSARFLKVKALEMDNDGDQNLMTFVTPTSVKGMGFLNYSHILEPDEQWVFMPTNKRVKRIASRNKSGPFFGSEFAYEDLSSFEFDKYDYQLVREEVVLGKDTYVLEMKPKYAFSRYSKLHSYIDKEHFIFQKIEFFDVKEKMLKTLIYDDYKQYANRYWRPSKMTMKNHMTNKTTVIDWKNYRFQQGLNGADFNISALKRTR